MAGEIESRIEELDNNICMGHFKKQTNNIFSSKNLKQNSEVRTRDTISVKQLVLNVYI
jgi:hypothetical protein